MTHPIVAAAKQFQADELRRRKRKQKSRLEAEDLFFLTGSITAIEATGAEHIDRPAWRHARGMQAVEIFGYSDTFDEKAATVITDILHAARAQGFSPQAILNQAAAYYAEER